MGRNGTARLLGRLLVMSATDLQENGCGHGILAVAIVPEDGISAGGGDEKERCKDDPYFPE